FLLFKSDEFRCYTYTILILSLLIAGILYFHHQHNIFDAVTVAFYQVISIATSTGSACVDYQQWGFSAKILLFIAMFTGSCAGSAGGGIKMTRWLLVFKSMKAELFRVLHPNAVTNIKVDNAIIQPEVVRQIIVFVFFYFFIFGVSAIAMAMIEQDAVIGLTGSITSLGDIGPGLGHTIGPMGNYSSLHVGTKLIYIFNMLIGRLELIPFLIFLQKDFWSIKQS
ncbi:TrkH family potassium uptake protein, partial [bacterium]|nr:TrkH family potassium uptake protein [bacterium]